MRYTFTTKNNKKITLKSTFSKTSKVEIKIFKEYVKVSVIKFKLSKKDYKKINDLGIDLLNDKIDLKSFLLYKKIITDNKPKTIQIFKNKSFPSYLENNLFADNKN